MPELPEVETIKNQLSPLVIGKHIQRIEFLWPNTLLSPSFDEFKQRTEGSIIESIGRRGKYLILRLSKDEVLLIHLRMTGSLLASNDSTQPNRYTRAIIHLTDGFKIFFIDPRKFGKFHLITDSDSPLLRLGPEPLEKLFTRKYLASIISGKRAPIKATLLDQSLIAGIGNMYADEALYAANIYPLRSAGDLSEREIEKLHDAIKRVLRTAIENGGASVSDYFQPDGGKGHAQEFFIVAHRKGQRCPKCQSPIERIVVNQRGTYYCPKCQLL
ncbi:MAG: bifunctional DNA-formamidopyrimidine glycosylase/DNA-(apurinic or apyrimidinic site) lyase [Dehalococcoidia bacterium]|nr:bifunctional DNA-formamidopyrimidine glycosylase/DNA-(apurinic or apyrimidinic site) lyase [Dehalococcoidia bacterium]